MLLWMMMSFSCWWLVAVVLRWSELADVVVFLVVLIVVWWVVLLRVMQFLVVLVV